MFIYVARDGSVLIVMEIPSDAKFSIHLPATPAVRVGIGLIDTSGIKLVNKP